MRNGNFLDLDTTATRIYFLNIVPQNEYVACSFVKVMHWPLGPRRTETLEYILHEFTVHSNKLKNYFK